ncbi:MAG: formate acetyltransferase [candidate division WOR-3 bacterium]|nr:formate acetyltransferase [candidate division WOR-3 bacterium]
MSVSPGTTDFEPREVAGSPSTSRVKAMRERYLAEPLVVDAEYMRLYTEAHRRTDGRNVLERRAECHAYALENLTPVVRPFEPFVGSKTRYVRGAIPYCHYACQYILREFRSEEQEAQDKVTDLGTGGGIARAREMAASGEYEFFAGKFLLSREDKHWLRDAAEYWAGKCMQDVGDDLWKQTYEAAAYIENGWRAILYTAPHDPAPEGRYVLDFETALAQGFNGIIRRLQEKIRDAEVTDYRSAEKVFFWRAGIRVLEATMRWAANYGRRARELAAAEPDPARRQELLQIAERCTRVPGDPPRDFREALQAFWFVYLAGHIEGSQLGYSPGRFDRYMYPYYQRDRTAGRATDAEVLELLEALRVKMTEIEYVASFSWEGLGSGNLYQNLILGGTDEHGRPADNELSRLVLQAAINCQTTQPTLSIWYDDTLSEEFLLKGVECVKTGCGFPAWFNLKVYLQHELQKSGLPLGTIRKYAAMGGCTEPTLEGMSYGIVQAGFINHMKLFELALNGGVDPRTGIRFDASPVPGNYAELVEAYLFHLERAIRNWQRYWNYAMAAHRLTCNLIYSSVLVRDCVERGLSLDDGGAVCNGTPTTLSTGLVNVANALSTVKQLVDDDRVCTLDELRAACRANWEGHDDLRRRALAAPKWGNNDDRVDGIYQQLFETYCDYVSRQANYLGQPYDPSMLAISTHTPFGKACLATPDGRYAGESLCDGVTSPQPGTDTHGPLSVLLSAGKVDHTRIRGGLHNLKLHPSALRGIEGARKLLALIRTYFEYPGFQLQFNVVDTAMLRDAQAHPQNYRDLIVRVAGFSAFFVELSRSIQDQIIARTEHGL